MNNEKLQKANQLKAYIEKYTFFLNRVKTWKDAPHMEISFCKEDFSRMSLPVIIDDPEDRSDFINFIAWRYQEKLDKAKEEFENL